MFKKRDLFLKSVNKYGKVLSKYYIRDIILDNDIETATMILKDKYKEEVEYNAVHRNDN